MTGGYRPLSVMPFALAGIRPEGVISYNDEALSWDIYKGIPSSRVSPNFSKLFKDLNQFEDETQKKKNNNTSNDCWGENPIFFGENFIL